MAEIAERKLVGPDYSSWENRLGKHKKHVKVTAPFLKGKAGLIKEGNYEAQFPLELMLKDLHLLDLTAYEEKQPLFLAGLAKSLYGQANSAGHGRDDFAAVFDYLGRLD